MFLLLNNTTNLSKGTNIMFHFKSVHTDVFRVVVAVSWKFVPSVDLYHFPWERRHPCRHLPGVVRNCGSQSWATNTCARLSSYGQSSSGMRAQFPRSVRSLKYRNCGVFPDVAALPEWLRIGVNSCVQRRIFYEEEYRNRPEDERPRVALVVARSRQSPDVNTVVTNKQCQFSGRSCFMLNNGEHCINKCQRKVKWRKIKLFKCAQLIFPSICYKIGPINNLLHNVFKFCAINSEFLRLMYTKLYCPIA